MATDEKVLCCAVRSQGEGAGHVGAGRGRHRQRPLRQALLVGSRREEGGSELRVLALLRVSPPGTVGARTAAKARSERAGGGGAGASSCGNARARASSGREEGSPLFAGDLAGTRQETREGGVGDGRGQLGGGAEGVCHQSAEAEDRTLPAGGSACGSLPANPRSGSRGRSRSSAPIAGQPAPESAESGMSYKPIAPAPTSSGAAGTSSSSSSASPAPGAPSVATSVPSPSGAISGASAPFRPLFNDFGPPSMGYVQAMKPPGAQGSQSTYTDLLSVIEEMGKEIRPTYAGSKSAMERLKRGIIHARALVRECLAETERNART